MKCRVDYLLFPHKCSYKYLLYIDVWIYFGVYLLNLASLQWCHPQQRWTPASNALTLINPQALTPPPSYYVRTQNTSVSFEYKMLCCADDSFKLLAPTRDYATVRLVVLLTFYCTNDGLVVAVTGAQCVICCSGSILCWQSFMPQIHTHTHFHI